jgi:hypothetical protein
MGTVPSNDLHQKMSWSKETYEAFENFYFMNS